MANIKQTDLLKYLAEKFNNNSFGIPFKMGSYEAYEDEANKVHLFIYAPQNTYDGKFDERYIFNESTYQTEKVNFVVMSGGISSGEYVPLPNVQLVSYDVSLSFLVFIDNPISEIIRLAIEEVRDELIGNLDTLEINEIDLTTEATDAPQITSYLKLATTADSIVFGEIQEILGRRYIEYSVNVTLTVSKNVELGNQFEWEIAKVSYNNSWEQTENELLAPYDYDVQSFSSLPTEPERDGLKARVLNEIKTWYSFGSWDSDKTPIPIVDTYNSTSPSLKQAIVVSGTPSSSDLPDITSLASGYIVRINSSTPIGYSYKWSTLVTDPVTYDYDVNAYSELPNATSSGKTARIRPITGQSWSSSNLSEYLSGNPQIDFGTWETVSDFTTALNSTYPASSQSVNTVLKAVINEEPFNGATIYRKISVSYGTASYYITEIDETFYKYYYWVVSQASGFSYFKSVSIEKEEKTFYSVIPLIADFGTTQDLESFQTLRSMNTTNEKFKQVHNYVKSRGYAMTFTFLLDTTQTMIRNLFKECFEILSSPNIYVVNLKFKELDENGKYVYLTDMQRSGIRVVLEEASPSEIVYGEPVAFSVGLNISAK